MTISNMPIVFLDIDEVLNCGQFRDYLIYLNKIDRNEQQEIQYKELLNMKIKANEEDSALSRGDWIQRDLLEHLHFIRDNLKGVKNGVRFIIVSSWATNSQKAERVARFLGIPTVLGVYNYKKDRQSAIDEFLQERGTTNYVIIDDAPSLYREEVSNSRNFINVNGRYGLTRTQAELAVQLLLEGRE